MKKIVICLLFCFQTFCYSSNDEHPVRIFMRRLMQQGAAHWNQYRQSTAVNAREVKFFLLSNVFLSGPYFDGIYLRNVSFYDSTIRNALMRRSNLYEMSFSGSSIENSDLSYSNLKKCGIQVKQIINTNFSNTNMANGGISCKSMKNCNFNSIYAVNGDISANNIDNLNFKKAYLHFFSLYIHFLRNSNFQNADLSNAKILSTRYAIIDNVNFREVKFENTKFGHDHKNLPFISHLSFIKSDFKGSSFKMATFIKRVKFLNCNFTDVDFRRVTTIQNAAFVNCDFNKVKIEKKWFNYLKTQGVKNFDKINWE